ncbi:hypothetical protein [Arthrobacter sp. SX1312]|uniref:hypothetical protein n=1 Tax=Arthrobacter sp. SX1312 TaxID=2058896 RepID=UPI0011B0AC76|nr:hypothetical protein [Arthrobacter sp. SX1312]
MTSKKTARPGPVLSVVGGIVLVASAVLLVMGIDALNAVTYRESGDSVVGAYLLIGFGAVAFLAGGALLAAGRRRHAADMNRPRTYADQHEDHALTAEDRPTNPHDTKARENPIGYWG